MKVTDFEWEGLREWEISGIEVIHLRELRTFDISLTKNACLAILKLFDLSRATQINITCNGYHLSDSIISPSHLLNRFPSSIPHVSYTNGSIAFSAAFAIIGAGIGSHTTAMQYLKITLLLVHMKGEPGRKWIRRIINRWVANNPFRSMHYSLHWNTGASTEAGRLRSSDSDTHVETLQ